jgi:hypothetical protein
MIVVGIAGRQRSGKDTVAKYLVENHGFTRIAFGDALKAEVATRLRRTLLAYVRAVPIPSFLNDDDLIAWLIETKPPMIRALLQEYATEVRRADQHDYWVNAWWRTVVARHPARVVVPDVRFPNEAALCNPLVLVVRPGIAAVPNDHISEDPLNEAWNAVLTNNGSIEDLHLAIEFLVIPLIREAEMSSG